MKLACSQVSEVPINVLSSSISLQQSKKQIPNHYHKNIRIWKPSWTHHLQKTDLVLSILVEHVKMLSILSELGSRSSPILMQFISNSGFFALLVEHPITQQVFGIFLLFASRQRGQGGTIESQWRTMNCFPLQGEQDLMQSVSLRINILMW